MAENPSLTADQDRSLTVVCEEVRAEASRLRRITGEGDSSRILVVLAAGAGSAQYLAGSLPELLAQATSCNVGLDLVIGLNNGYRCDALTQTLVRNSSAAYLELYAEPRRYFDRPAPIYSDASTPGWKELAVSTPHFSHRLIVIRQPSSRFSPGKIRVLGDIYNSLLIPAVEERLWLPPKFCLWADAESHFFLCSADSQSTLPGFCYLVSELNEDPNLDLLGTRVRFTAYHKVSTSDGEIAVPNLSEPIAPVYRLLSLIHGLVPGAKWLPGGGTLGRTSTALAVMSVISRLYPCSRVEDCQATIIARHAGIRCTISNTVYSANHCPSSAPIDSAQGNPHYLSQLARWLSGILGLTQLYGASAVAEIISVGNFASSFQDRSHVQLLLSHNAYITPNEFAACLLRARIELARALRTAQASPDRFLEEGAPAGW